ncbi:MAG TPA: carboxypeptidase-like regulatory domain-containing protein [Terriglobia bacterium]|nr:carboxypeptidase-like regulatory domain-containing protein [Terriglobia bacterium]
MRYAAIVPLSLLFASSAVSQQTPASPSASIEGVVTRLDTGAPVVGAQVTLTVLNPLTAAMLAGADPAIILAQQTAQPIAQTPPPQIPPSNTDAEGKFAFKNLAAGTYRVMAVANGFVRQEYGQRSQNGQGTPIVLAANQNMKEIALRLTPAGTVSGRILDENGQPALGIPVQLLRQTYNVTGRTYQAVGTTAADDRGQYRLFGVPPGRYYLNIGNPPGPIRMVAPAGVGVIGGQLAGGTAYAFSYFPGVADASQAVMIEVKSGQEVSFDMTARRQQTYRVRGTLLDSRTGQPPAGNVQVMLGYRTPMGGAGSFSSGRNYDPATGRFELLNVIPGQYVVQAQIQEAMPTPVTSPQQIEERLAAQAMQPSGRAPITVTDRDVENVAITLNTATTLTGKIAVEGQALSTLTGIDRIRVNLRAAQDGIPVVSAGQQPAPAVIGADGTFRIVGMREGEFTAQVAALPPGFYVKSIQYGGSDILNNPFRFSGSASGSVDVIVRPGSARVSGVVTDARSQIAPGVQAVLVPEQRTRTDLYRTATTDQTGRFNFTNVTPGQYRIFCWEAFEPGMQFDPEALKKSEQQGKLIQVAEASDQNLDLKVIPAN